MRYDRKKKANCKDCPFRDSKVVKGKGPGDAEVLILGEAPGAVEEQQGEPFVGPAGNWLTAALGKSGIRRENAWLTNVISCRPPKNDMTTHEALMAKECCRPGLEAELKLLKGKELRVMVPVGNHAIHSLGIDGSITKVRGSVYVLEKDLIAVPTYHPSYIMRGQIKEETTWIGDLIKANDLSKKSYKPPKERFILHPSLDEVSSFVSQAIKKKSLLGVDIETTGFDPNKSRIKVIGLAVDGERALSVSLLTEDYKSYWENEGPIDELLGELFRKCPTMYQNALFDVRFLKRRGYKINLEHDSLILHHCIHPELPHSLGYIVSVYGKTPYWKEGIRATGDEFLRYNLRDAVVLHQVLRPMLEDLEDSGTEDVYHEISMPLVGPIIDMIDRGIKMSPTKLKRWSAELESKLVDIEGRLREVTNVPEGFNFKSRDHLVLLVHGEVAKQFERAKKEIQEYDEPNTRRKKNTKKYRELVSVAEVADNTVPLYSTKATKRKTKGGNISVDEQSLLTIKIAAMSRLEELTKLKRPKKKEQAEVDRLLAFLDGFLEYQGISKLYSTYTDFPTDGKNRVHFTYKIHGTNTGRLSSGGEAGNAQNIPEEARKVFVSEKGYKLVSLDYRNLELVILAFLSNDDVAIKAFHEGKNFHDENTKDMFGIDESDPQWSVLRAAMKVYRFGRNYGGSLYGIYRRVMEKVPESGLTFETFKRIDADYRRKHPKYAKWFDETVREVKATRALTNAFGRKRYFLGTESEITREGANFPVQSSASDLVNRSQIKLYRTLREKDLDGYIVLQKHDELLLEVRNDLVKKVAKIAQGIMQEPVTIGKYEVSFPVDAEVGTCWGEMKELKIPSNKGKKT